MRFSRATWIGSPNFTPKGITKIRFVILHIEEGTEGGTESWFQDPKAQVSAHFGNGKDGRLVQFVDSGDMAWAEAGGNPECLSIEEEGNTGDSLTPAQLENDAQVLAWAHTECGVPLQITDDPINGSGLGWHGMGLVPWGNHPQCPGSPIVAQRALIVARAKEILAPPVPPIPPGFGQRIVSGMTWTPNPIEAGDWLVYKGKRAGIPSPDDLKVLEEHGVAEKKLSASQVAALTVVKWGSL